MIGCEGDMHYRDTCSRPRVLETVFDIKNTVNPTHGFFATHLHSEIWPQIVLRDFGIGVVGSYVGYVDEQWLRDPKRNEQCNGNVMRQLPPKLLFIESFVNSLPTYLVYGQIFDRLGNLKWYKTIQIYHMGNKQIENIFIHCTMQGHNFVWNLQPNHKDSCESGCHTTGLWRD